MELPEKFCILDITDKNREIIYDRLSTMLGSEIGEGTTIPTKQSGYFHEISSIRIVKNNKLNSGWNGNSTMYRSRQFDNYERITAEEFVKIFCGFNTPEEIEAEVERMNFL